MRQEDNAMPHLTLADRSEIENARFAEINARFFTLNCVYSCEDAYTFSSILCFLCTDGVPSVKAFDTSSRFSFYRMMTMIPAVQKIIPSHSRGEYFSLRCITE